MSDTLVKPEMKDILERFNEFQSALIRDPNCRHCYGTGKLGIQHTYDKNGNVVEQLLICRCARLGETEYVRLQKRIDDLTVLLGEKHKELLGTIGKNYLAEENRFTVVKELMDKHYEVLNRKTFWSDITRFIKRLLGKEQK